MVCRLSGSHTASLYFCHLDIGTVRSKTIPFATLDTATALAIERMIHHRSHADYIAAVGTVCRFENYHRLDGKFGDPQKKWPQIRPRNAFAIK